MAIACIVFVCTAVNHLGLISAIESAIERKLWIVDCPKCITCWSVMAYQLVTGCHPLTSLAIALLSSYLAIWLNMFLYAIDTFKNKVYDKIEKYDKEGS